MMNDEWVARGNGEWGMGKRDWGMGKRDWGMGNGEWEFTMMTERVTSP
ncbi:hypothetical protein C943_01307 [Mariniradius saccharolyticus AK6]|uniref:Uncharacterized protein n=1 Tax=Mariniradius saccharolyticus AK6 TaxID=1239962 RepID=M7X544_9BACT|nr:hypothetical protein C943_01307 [Mariniradius saccharolyticus AK6]